MASRKNKNSVAAPAESPAPEAPRTESERPPQSLQANQGRLGARPSYAELAAHREQGGSIEVQTVRERSVPVSVGGISVQCTARTVELSEVPKGGREDVYLRALAEDRSIKVRLVK